MEDRMGGDSYTSTCVYVCVYIEGDTRVWKCQGQRKEKT